MNETYSIIKSIDLKIKLDVVDAYKFKKNYKDIFNQLPSWMRHFFGFKYLFNYIYDEKTNLYNKESI